MKKWILKTLIGIVSTASCVGLAQSDPSALSLTGASGTSSPSSWSGDTNYVHKKPKKQKRKVASTDAQPTPTPTSSLAVTRLGPSEVGVAVVTPQPTATVTPTKADPNFASKVKSVVLGGDEDLLQDYKAFLDDQDIRKNVFELTIGTGYLYNASSSSYFFKNYNDSGPTADVNADIWLSPFLGVTAEYKTTLLNEVLDSPTQNSYVSTTQSWFDLGFKFRRFFGMTLNAPAMTAGLRYIQYQMNSPQTSLSRAKLSIQGPELDIDMSLPMGKFSLWTLGLMIQPIDSLSETSGATVRAGQNNQTIGFGASVGAEYRFSREVSSFLKLSSTIYKTDFSGSASTVDPVTGSIPSNVPVTNIFYFLDVGVRFGR